MFFYSLRIFVLNVLKRFRGAALEVLFQESRAHTSSTRRGSDPEIVFWNSDSHVSHFKSENLSETII